ncbi:unnamed protein product (macronuclear) [Paramecium tetraurelia]|uniref:CS domain-containing protein n=1 Tax=Paramecium tetraurelia TaxID=5888 RepID=A0DX15_PARTE|nr:uncharacterized protein GSPATT00021214001 [Paramecium tetraurelia]CAK87582.1 unnamed protein product [Paramecium tetraurelia]|eukprot:XP_001454979.1 hypothetical protein (macronuclear) [Paramecium tetraurelia strain d4-2]
MFANQQSRIPLLQLKQNCSIIDQISRGNTFRYEFPVSYGHRQMNILDDLQQIQCYYNPSKIFEYSIFLFFKQMLEPSKEFQEKAKGRQKFQHQGRTIYEWDQTLDDINIYIEPPKAVLKKYEDQLDIQIKADRLKVGIKGNPPFMDEALVKQCDSSESYWLVEDEELHIILQKAYKGELWPSVFVGHGKVDPMTEQELQKKMLLERFQEEHPGFDFSGAQVNGMVPDARSFMGGIKHN